MELKLRSASLWLGTIAVVRADCMLRPRCARKAGQDNGANKSACGNKRGVSTPREFEVRTQMTAASTRSNN